MKKTCRISNCFSSATGYGIYCRRHKTIDRRHGDPTQRGVTRSDLKPYKRMVLDRIHRNTESPVWEKADLRWQAVVQHAACVIDRFSTGKPGFGWERKAALEIIKLSEHVPPREVVETILAMYLMQDLEPNRFVSDRAFRTQLVRRVRGLSKASAGEWFDQTSGKVKRAYTELPPRVTRTIAEWLVSALGGVGVYLARLEKETARQKEREARELAEALEGVR